MPGHVVLVHGAWSSPADWRWVEALLAEQGRLVDALDLLSHRRHDATRADDVEQLAAVVAATDEPTVVVGWSYGGAVMTDLDAGALSIARFVYVASIPGLPPSDEQEPVALEAVVAPPVRAAWRDVDTTVILGRDDELIPEPQQRWVIDAVDDVQVVDSDHFIPFRPPEVIVQAITEALS